MRLAVVLGFGLALAACDKPAPAPQAQPTVAMPAPPPLFANGWASVFADASHAIDVFGRIGLRPGPYVRSGDRYEAKGTPAVLSRTVVAKPNVANFVATGDAKTLESLAFSLDLIDAGEADFAKAQFQQQLRQVFFQFKLPGDKAVLEAVAREVDAKGSVPGADYVVTREPIDGAKARRLIVTFSRAGVKPGSTDSRNG